MRADREREREKKQREREVNPTILTVFSECMRQTKKEKKMKSQKQQQIEGAIK